MKSLKYIIFIYLVINFNRIYAKNVPKATVIDDKIGQHNPSDQDTPQAPPSVAGVTDKPNGSSQNGAIVIKDVNITYQLSNCNNSVADVKPMDWKPFVDIPKQNPGKFDRFDFENNRDHRELKQKIDKLIGSSECSICRACLHKFRASTKLKKPDKPHKIDRARHNELKTNLKSVSRSDFEAINGDNGEMTNKREKREHIEKPKTTRKRKARRNRKSKKTRRSKKKLKSKSNAYDGMKEKRTETITSITKLKFHNIKSEILQVNETERKIITSAIKGVPDKVKNITNTCNLYQVTKLMTCASPEASKLQLESLRNALLQTEQLDSKFDTTAKYDSASKAPPESITYTSTSTKSEKSAESKHEAEDTFIDDIVKEKSKNYQGVF